jgi:hypothetical protein
LSRGAFLSPFGRILVGDALIDIRLLVAVEAPGDAAPEDPPLNFRLHLIAEREAGGIDPPGLFNPEFVAGEAGTRPQTEARFQPAGFVGGGALAAVGELEKQIGKAANDAQGPTGAAEAEQLFEFGGELFGREGAWRRRSAG